MANQVSETFSTQDAYEYILYLKEEAKRNGKTEITIKALGIARHFKRYDRIVPMCGAMRKAMNRGDEIIHTPPKGNSITLEIYVRINAYFRGVQGCALY